MDDPVVRDGDPDSELVGNPPEEPPGAEDAGVIPPHNASTRLRFRVGHYEHRSVVALEVKTPAFGVPQPYMPSVIAAVGHFEIAFTTNDPGALLEDIYLAAIEAAKECRKEQE